MNIIHKSKTGLEILIPTILILGAVTTIMIVNLIWIGLVMCGLVILLMVNIYTETHYTITSDNRLLIKCGIMMSVEVNIDSIEWIKKTNELTNAPALSVDRLEIGYKNERVLVSPQDQNKFVDDLRKLNPEIRWTK